MITNGVMLQSFEWYTKDDGKFYNNLKDDLENLKELGITGIWIPPCFKGQGGTYDVGYGCYDIFDLGEFDQKGTVRTKYGTKAELLDLIKKAHELKISIYADVVLNHKAGADYAEKFKAVKVDQNDRNKDISEAYDIEGYTGFNFPGRNKKYSEFVWNFNHFTGVDYDEINKEKAIFRIVGDNKYWSYDVSSEYGNYDYLMFSDIDHRHPDVKAELFRWADWFINETKVDGFRLDAVKHIDSEFMRDFVNYIKEKQKDFYFVGEYWSFDEDAKKQYAYKTEYEIDLFDVKLHMNFMQASIEKGNYDLRKIFDDTVVSKNPLMAVTFVDNHDSQPYQSLSSWVGDWFKPIAYAMILMRKDGYPCIFGGDFYGICGENPIESKREIIEKILNCRKNYAYGEEDNYFQNENLIGWVRRGDENHGPSATLSSNKAPGEISMFVGEEEIGKIYNDKLGFIQEEVKIDEKGFGIFKTNGESVSIWAEK